MTYKNTLNFQTVEIQSRVVLTQKQQQLLRLHCPALVESAAPGKQIHIQIPETPHITTLSIHRFNIQENWIEIIHPLDIPNKIKQLNAALDNTAGFKRPPQGSTAIFIADDEGLSPLLCMIDHIRRESSITPVLFLETETHFSFNPVPSRLFSQALPPEAIAAIPLLEDWGILSRLAHHDGFPGCYEGSAVSLTEYYLEQISPNNSNSVTIYASGVLSLLTSAALLAQKFQLACQLHLLRYFHNTGTQKPPQSGVLKIQDLTIDLYNHGPVISGNQLFVPPQGGRF